MQQGQYYWRVKDMVLAKGPVLDLAKPNEEIALTVPTKTIRELMLAHLRIRSPGGLSANVSLREFSPDHSEMCCSNCARRPIPAKPKV